MEYTIQNGRLTLSAWDRGAGLRRVALTGGRELLWDGRPEIWPGRAPVCFPWCGPMEEGWYEYRGRRYSAPTRHGFIRDLDHTLVDRGEESLTFQLDWDGEGDCWPWPFRFRTVHRLEGDRAFTVCTAENRGREPMPVQLGFHPAFLCPFVPGTELEEYQVRFANGLTVPLERHLFDNDSIPYEGVGDWARLEHPATGRYIEVNTAGFFRVLLWSKPGIPGFVCIEPWHGFPGPEHDPFRRPGTAALAPGEERTWTLEMTFKV